MTSRGTTTGKTILHWIDGQETPGVSTRRGPVYQPATGEVQAEVLLAEPADVDAAVAAATKAALAWRETSLMARARILFAFRELMHRHVDILAELICDEHGKVVSDARGEVIRGLEVVEFACGIPHLLKGEYSDSVSSGVDAYSLRQPLGVCAGITPFNFPAMVPLWMHPLAIATGNAFVLKPSERDPSASLLVARLYAEAGLPAGVFNVVQGDRVAVESILDHPGIAAVSFVGSTPVARLVHARASAAGKRVQALGGAKNHAVVLPDADLDVAAAELTAAGYGSAGQRCMAISVVVAVGAAADGLVERLARRAAAITLGPGRNAESEMGPLVTAEAADRVSGYVDRAAAGGATVVVDGRNAAVPGHAAGFFVGPDARRPRPARRGGLRRRDLRSRARRGPGGVVGRGDRAGQRQPVRQRHGDLHGQRRGGAAVPARRRGRDGGHQRADPGADGLLLLRRLEGLVVRRHPHARAGGGALLHPGQGGHVPLAGRPDPRGRDALPDRHLSDAAKVR